MKKRKEAQDNKNEFNKNLFEYNSVESCFEIGADVTEDVAEAVAILMIKAEPNHPIWETELKNINVEELTPEKSLFWLSGGTKEWQNLEHYNRPWCDAYLEFQEEFGMLIVNIVKKAKKLKDVRDKFNKYLSLPTLYDFAISRNMIK
jgi:hypothetical protein